MKNENNFEYNYTAPTASERREIESIRNSYLNKDEPQSKLVRLRKLDARVRNVPMIISLTLGVIGVLTFGLGLTMILEWKLYLWGCMVAAVGLIPSLVAYLSYKHIKKYLTNKYADEIVNLSNELLNEKNN